MRFFSFLKSDFFSFHTICKKLQLLLKTESKSKLPTLLLGKSSKFMFETKVCYIAQTGLKFKILISASRMTGFQACTSTLHCSRFLLLVLPCLQFILVTIPLGLLSFLLRASNSLHSQVEL